MFFQNISYIAVAIAAVASMGTGFIWYSPWLFGKRWAKEMGMSGSKSFAPSIKDHIAALAFALISAFVVAVLMNSLVVAGVWSIALIGIVAWLGFSLPTSASYFVYGRDSFALFAINSGYQLAALVVSALVIGIFG